jgi:3-oxoacyl-[acyl-carrier protein] reductase
MRFADKVVLVTGSSRNLGKAIAEGFAREGAQVVLNARESALELEATASELRARGHDVLPVLADVGDPDAVDRLVGGALDAYGRIDILMINHSVQPTRPFLELTREEWHSVVAMHLHSTLYLCQAVLPGMVERRSGHVIAIGGGSGTGSRIYPRPHVYASIAGRTALLRSLIQEFGPYGIRFNFVSPGVMETVRNHPEWFPGAPDDGRSPHKSEALLQAIPLGRPGSRTRSPTPSSGSPRTRRPTWTAP